MRTFGPSPFQYQDRPRLVAQLGHSAAPLSVAVSADGRWAATGGSRDRTAVLWELDTGLELQRFEVPDEIPGAGGVTALAFSSEGDAVLAGTDGGTVLLWQVATGTLLRRFDVGAETQRRVAFSPDNLQDGLLRAGGDPARLRQPRRGEPGRARFGGRRGPPARLLDLRATAWRSVRADARRRSSS